MLKPRLSVARPLGFCLWVGAVALAGFWGCQGPDTFLRKEGTGGTTGAGGFRGIGGAIGVGGHIGMGGTIGTGGGAGVGGRIGTGGVAVDGSTGTGGVTGTGGARDGGVDAPGIGGMTGTGGRAVVDANPDSEGGVVAGTGPCASFCSPANSFSEPPNYGSPPLGLGAACYETLSEINGGGCSNCTGRTVTLNGMPESNSGGNFTIPAKINGGYCIQVGPAPADGGVTFSTFYTYFP